MRWNLTKLLAMEEPLQFSEQVVFDDFKAARHDVRGLSSVNVEGTVEMIKNRKEILFHLTISGTFEMACAVSLKSVSYPFTVETVETMTYDQYASKEAYGDYHFIKGVDVDIRALVWELIFLELPSRVVCENLAQNELPQSGSGWKVIDPNVPKKDERFSKLRELLNNQNK
ncbi:MAG: YceD family protein [Culicoidibacterales bacterium]